MAYKSPFHFLPIGGITTPLDPVVIQRAKKKLLAELELSEQNIVDFSKNDLLQWFDNLKAEELAFHRYIFENKSLLNFLETGTVTPGDWTQTLPVDQALQHFVLREVQKQYDHLFAEAFRSSDSQRIKELSAFTLPDIEKKGRYYFSEALNLLTAHYHQLLQFTKNWEPQQESQLREFLSLPFFSIIAILPSYFQAMRDEFAVTLMQLGEKVSDEKHKQYALAKEIAQMSRAIGPSAAVRVTIGQIEKEKILSRKTEEPAVEKKGRKGWVAWVIFIFLLLNLLRVLISALS
jgi:hypothetical protein